MSRFFAGSPPEPEPGGPEVFEVTAAPDGAWPVGLGGQPFYANGFTYFGFADNAGAFRVGQFVHSTGVVNLATLKTVATPDQHNRPALVRRSSDGRLVAMYCEHAGGAMYRRISTNADDISAWGSEANIDSSLGSTAYTYPFITELEDESKLYLFYRDQDGVNNWEISTSSDGGSTWSAFTNVVWATRAYARAFKSSSSRLDFVVTDGSYCADKASMYHFYYEGGDYFTSDGSMISGSPPFDFADLTLVYDGSSEGARGPASHAKVGTDIAVVFPVQTGSCGPVIGTNEDYVYSRWDGATWTNHGIALNVGGTTVDYTEGSLAIDPADLNRVFLSKRVAGQWQMHIYTTADAGATWSVQQITSTTDANMYPELVNDHEPELEALWLTGTFTDQSTYDDGIQGYGVPV